MFKRNIQILIVALSVLTLGVQEAYAAKICKAEKSAVSQTKTAKREATSAVNKKAKKIESKMNRRTRVTDKYNGKIQFYEAGIDTAKADIVIVLGGQATVDFLDSIFNGTTRKCGSNNAGSGIGGIGGVIWDTIGGIVGGNKCSNAALRKTRRLLQKIARYSNKKDEAANNKSLQVEDLNRQIAVMTTDLNALTATATTANTNFDNANTALNACLAAHP